MIEFFKQTDDTNCQLIALKTALSFFNKYPSDLEIKRSLPKHSFGNFISELGIYSENNGIKTKIISNNANIRKSNLPFLNSIKEYKNCGKYENRIIEENDLGSKPVIVNVDWYKVKEEEVGCGAHYAVVIRMDGKLWLFDGSNYDMPVPITWDKVIQISKCINKHNDDGMFLIMS